MRMRQLRDNFSGMIVILDKVVAQKMDRRQVQDTFWK